LQGFGAQAVTLGSKAKSNHRVFRVRAHQGFEGFDGGKGCEKKPFFFSFGLHYQHLSEPYCFKSS